MLMSTFLVRLWLARCVGSGKRILLNTFRCSLFDDRRRNWSKDMSSPASDAPLTKRTVKLNNGINMPIIGLGTFRIVGEENIFRSVEAALKSDYRLIDTAAVYDNEEDIGKALKKFLPKYNLKREDIFLTSKLSPSDLHPQRVEKAVRLSCSNLGVSYLDLYLIHWPGASGYAGNSELNSKLRGAVWEELVKLNKSGVLRSIGVSNYTIGHLTELQKNNYGVDPAVNQVEAHPHFPQLDLAAFCEKHNIALQAYASFGGAQGTGPLLQDPNIIKVAEKLKQPVPQLLLRWALQHNFLVIPKSLSPERIASNLELDFEIPRLEMKILDNLPNKAKYAWDPTTIA